VGPLPNRPGANTRKLQDSAAQSQDVHLRLSKALQYVQSNKSLWLMPACAAADPELSAFFGGICSSLKDGVGCVAE